MGIVADVKKDDLGLLLVALGTGQTFETPQAWCYVHPSQQPVAARLSRGNLVAARGTVTGLMLNVDVHDCLLMQ